MGKPEISDALFGYITHNSDGIRKETLENRLIDLLGTHEPNMPLIQELYLTPELILAITTFSEYPVPTECGDIKTLLACFPSILSDFHRAVVNNIIPVSPHTSWQKLRMISPSINPDKSHLLFSSSRDGCSFRALFSCIKNYPGTLVFLFTARSDPISIFGFCSNRSEWTETQSFDQSATDTCMFELEPRLAIRRSNSRGSSNYLYCNISNNNRPVGLGLGGRESAHRLWLDGKNILSVSMMQSDATFEPNHFVSGASGDFHTQDIRTVEVWGFGGIEALDEQAIKKAAEAEVRNDRKRVDRSRMVENEFDRNVLLSKTFQSSEASNRLGNAYVCWCM
jgi:hypothetical protein